MVFLIKFTLIFATLILIYVSKDKLNGKEDILDYIDEQKGNGAVYPVKEEKVIVKIITAAILYIMILLALILILSLLFSSISFAEEIPLIHTPWNSEFYQGTIEQEVCIYAQGLISKFGGAIGFIGKELLKKHKYNPEKIIDNEILKKHKEQSPLWHTIIYEDFPHKLKDYREIEKYAKDWRDLNGLIEHIKKQKNKLKNEYAKREYQKYIDDLEHIRDYQKQLEETQQLNQMTTNTILLGIIAILGGIVGIGA